MSKQANPTLIGSFVIGAIVIGVFTLLTLGNLSLNKKSFRCVLYFQGSLHGLDIGAPVAYRGVTIGKVGDIAIAFNPSQNRYTIPVYIDIAEQSGAGKSHFDEAGFDTPDAFFRDLVQRGLRAKLKLRSIVTGKLFIEFSFAPDTDAIFSGEDNGFIEIPTLPSDLEQISQALEELPIQDIVTKTVSALDNINNLLGSDNVQETITRLNSMLLHTDELVISLDRQLPELTHELKQALAGFSVLIESSRALVEHADSDLSLLLAEVESSFVKIRTLVDQLVPVAENLTEITDTNSPLRYELSKILQEISSAAQSINQLGDYLQRYPNALLTGRKERE